MARMNCKDHDDDVKPEVKIPTSKPTGEPNNNEIKELMARILNLEKENLSERMLTVEVENKKAAINTHHLFQYVTNTKDNLMSLISSLTHGLGNTLGECNPLSENYTENALKCSGEIEPSE